MAYDSLTLSVLIKEFNLALNGGKINKITMPEKDEVVLHIFNKQNYKLLFCCNNNVNRVLLTEHFGDSPVTAPTFCMLLRKYISAATITSVTQQPFERLADFLISTKNQLGYQFDMHLIFELTGRDSNLILTDQNYKIIDSLRRFSCDTQNARIILPGATYKFFESQQKMLPTDFTQIMESAQKIDDVKTFLLENVQGISPATAKEICILADNTPQNLTFALKQYLLALQSPKPTILYDNDLPIDVFPFDYKSIKGKKAYFSTLNQAHDAFFFQKDEKQRFLEKSKGTRMVLKNAIGRTEKKLGIQQQALLEAEQNSTYKLYGDLILSNLYAISKNAEFFETENYFEDTSPKIRIPLDKKLSAKQNAQEYYKKYTKLKSSIKYNTKLVEENTQILDYLKGVLHSLSCCTTQSDLSQIIEELTENGIVKTKQKVVQGKKQVGKQQVATISPLKFSIFGYIVLVGKNNIQNEFVTFKTAHSTDLWLHVQNIHSSHAIIQNPDPTASIPPAVIQTTAEIVAAYSQAMQGTKIPIDFCQKKYVKKPNGAKKGFVIYTDFKTILVDPCRHSEFLSQ